MTDSPDAIRADIERTREDLGLDVDALADKVTPSKIAQRQADKVRGVFGTVRERVMGASDDAGSATSSAASGISNAAQDMKAKAEGNPMAVGLIAFGLGLLAASLIPASQAEKDMASRVKEQAQPLVDQVTDAAKEVAGNLKEPAQDAAQAVKDSATESVENLKQSATEDAGVVKDRAQEAQANVTNR